MGQILVGAVSICIVFLGILAVQRLFTENQCLFCPDPPSMVDYLFKISRVTGESEYSIFQKSAEDWPVSQAMIDQDFRRYLSRQEVPHYVKDFVRRNKHHLDDLKTPPFLNRV
jgi:hypothetical protein